MADVVEIEQALAVVQDFKPLQRVLLTCTGTLQGTLSAWFGGPMEIAVVEQARMENLDKGSPSQIHHRTIEMRHKAQCVMKAESAIYTAREDVRALVLERKLGLGQIMEKLGIRPEFKLIEAAQDDEHFWRVYKLHAPDVTYTIKETFPQCHYRG